MTSRTIGMATQKHNMTILVFFRNRNPKKVATTYFRDRVFNSCLENYRAGELRTDQ